MRGDMSSVTSRETEAGPSKELTIFSWPLRQEPGRSAWLLTFILGVTAYATFFTASWLVGIPVLLALLGSVWRLWLPVHFELGPRGVTQRIGSHRRRVPWGDITGYQLRRRGILLLADRRQGLFAPVQAIFVRYPAQPERLRELLELHLSHPIGHEVSDDVTVVTTPHAAPTNSPEDSRSSAASP